MSRKLLIAAAAALSLAGCAGTDTRESTGQYLDDTTITSKVKTALLRDPGTSGLDIQVETFKGTVQLSGFVDSSREKEKASMVAAGVGGVRSVKNDIRVK